MSVKTTATDSITNNINLVTPNFFLYLVDLSHVV